jgi:tetratricopeptide (TPR) repeat protein
MRLLFVVAALGRATADTCDLGLEALKQGDLGQAGVLLRQCVKARPSQVDPYLWLCAVYQQQKDSEALYKTASAALEKFPEEPRFYLTVATHDAREKRYHAAVKVLEEGLKRWPDDPSIRKLLANAHYAWGAELLDASDNEAAEQHLRRATELAPDDVEAHVNLGRAFHNLLRYSEALDAFNRVIELNPKTPLARFHRGLSYHSLGQFEHAIEDLTAEIADTPACTAVWMMELACFASRGNATASGSIW